MGVGSAGFDGIVRVKKGGAITSNSDGTSLGGVQTATVTPSNSTLDVTVFDDEGVNNLKGLEDTEITIDVIEEPDDAGQTDIEEVFSDANSIDIAFFPSGSSLGFTSQFIITEISHESEVDSPDTASITASQNDSSGFDVLT